MKARPNRKPSGPARRHFRHLLADIALPLVGLRFPMRIQMPTESKTRDANTEPKPSVSSRLAPLIPVTRRHDPGEQTRDERANPSPMNIGHDLPPLGFAQKCQHGDNDEQSFHAFA